MSTIEEQIRAKIAELKGELASYERALEVLTPKNFMKDIEAWVKPVNKSGATNTKSISVNDALLKSLADGPMPRKAILPAIEALRPGTTGQTVSSALNGLQKAKKVRLKNGVWSAL